MIFLHHMTFKVGLLGRFDVGCTDRPKVAYGNDTVLPNNSPFAVNPAQPADDNSV